MKKSYNIDAYKHIFGLTYDDKKYKTIYTPSRRIFNTFKDKLNLKETSPSWYSVAKNDQVLLVKILQGTSSKFFFDRLDRFSDASLFLGFCFAYGLEEMTVVTTSSATIYNRKRKKKEYYLPKFSKLPSYPIYTIEDPFDVSELLSGKLHTPKPFLVDMEVGYFASVSETVRRNSILLVSDNEHSVFSTHRISTLMDQSILHLLEPYVLAWLRY